MALTDAEETKIRSIIAEVDAAGVQPGDLTATLRIGKLTTQSAAIDARIQEARLGQQEANQALENNVQLLTQQKSEIEAQLRSMLAKA